MKNDRQVLRPVYLLLLISLGLAVLKLWAGYMQESSALRSVGVNNAADLLYGLVLWAGLWMSIQPPDSSHPEGHRRFESLVGIFVGTIVLLSGFYVIVDAGWSFYRGREVIFDSLGIVILLGSIAIKIVFSWHCNREGKKLNSPALRAISKDQLSDILNDIVVIAALIGVYSGFQFFDILVAVAIGLFIIKIGLDTLVENIDHLTGRSAPPEILEEIKHIILTDPVFEGPREIKSHHVGPLIHISLVVSAEEEKTLGAIHEAEENLKQKIKKLDNISRVYVHVEPRN
ncbi:MAG: cation diffusion facilitator family transporter [bacterium]